MFTVHLFAELWTEPSKRCCTFRALKAYFYVVFSITQWREVRENIAAGRGVLLQGLVFLESEDTWPEGCRSCRLFWIFPFGCEWHFTSMDEYSK